MTEQDRNTTDELGEINESPPSKNTTFHSFNNSDNNQICSEYSGLNQSIIDPVKYIDMQHMNIEQGNAMLTLKVTEYEKMLAEKDYTIQTLHTDMMNSQNNNFVLSNQYKNIMEKTRSVSDTCVHLNANFTSICERLNILGNTVDNARTRQKDVMNLVEQTTNSFQEKIINISCSIEDSLEKVNIEKMRTKHELEALENSYSHNLITHKTNLEECTKTIEMLKVENITLLEKLNEANINLNKEKETVLRFNLNFEKELMEIKDQNELLTNENKLVNVKYNEIITENQSLINELSMMKTTLEENKIQLEIQLKINKEHIKLVDNIKISEELNDTLQKENLALKEHNKHLENINTDLIDNSHNNKLAQKEIQEENKNKFEEMCANYDILLKMHEEKLLDMTKKLEFQNLNEKAVQNEIIDLKKEIEMSNKTIINLQEEVKANYILVPELQNKVDHLNVDLMNTNKKLRDSTKEFTIKQNELQKEKNEFENQNKEHFNQIEKLTANYMKYKSKAKQLYVEVLRLRYQCSQSEKKRTSGHSSKLETIEIKSDEEEIIDDDLSIIVCNDQSVSNMNTSIQSIKNKNITNTTLNKNSTSFINYQMKKHNVSTDIAASQDNMDSNGKNTRSQNNRKLTLRSLKDEYNLNNENKNLTESISNVRSNLNTKKIFNISDDIIPVQKRKKFMGKQKNDLLRPNSPVVLTIPSPKKLKS